jgi:chaperonin GroES
MKNKTKSKKETTPPVRPIGNMMLLKRHETSNTTDGGIILPENAREKSQKCTVIETGEGFLTEVGTRTPLQVKKGDVVFIPKHEGMVVTVGGVEQILIEEKDILAVEE